MSKKRLRDYGIHIGTMPTGKKNSITDINDLRVGHYTIINDENGCARTGVTSIIPHSKNLYQNNCAGSIYIHNGYGKAIGIPQVKELGYIETPIMLTNTLNVGKVADGLIQYLLKYNPKMKSVNSIVAECNDGKLNEIEKRFVSQENAIEALNLASSDIVEEGNVGGGTGMVAFGYKGGIGSASRLVKLNNKEYTIGSLVQANFGKRENLVIDGVPVGLILEEDKLKNDGDGSIVMIIATDAPFDSRQLHRIAKRASMGLARTGSIASNGSGDFVIAFSTSNIRNRDEKYEITKNIMAEDGETMYHFFKGAVEATEEAIINALFAASDMIGRDQTEIKALPKEKVIDIIKNYRYEFK
ncbi:MAG: P1 family peptidase [Clostridia bacterium]